MLKQAQRRQPMLPALRNVHSVIAGCPINYHGQFVSTIRYGSCSGLLIRIQDVWASNSVAEQRSYYNCTIQSLQRPILPDNRHSSSPFCRTCTRSADTRSETTGSDKRYLSHKIKTLYNLCTRKFVAKRPTKRATDKKVISPPLSCRIFCGLAGSRPDSLLVCEWPGQRWRQTAELFVTTSRQKPIRPSNRRVTENSKRCSASKTGYLYCFQRPSKRIRDCDKNVSL